jgi:hypothetical protein
MHGAKISDRERNPESLDLNKISFPLKNTSFQDLNPDL